MPQGVEATPNVAVGRPVTVVYLAYGPPRLVLNGVFSALTFERATRDYARPWRFAIYTDQPSLFREYGVERELIPLSVLRDENASAGYLHRSKMAAINHAAITYDGDIFYVDADTYFTASPERHLSALAPQCSIMHKAEYVVDAGTRPHLYDAIKSDERKATAIRLAADAPEIVMWNAGTLGIAETNKELIPEVLAVADELYGVYRYHLAEQLAWALVFSRVGTIMAADDLVYHYWFGQEEITQRVATFLRRNRTTPHSQLAERAYSLRPQATPDWSPPLSIRARVAARSLRGLYRQVRSGTRDSSHDKAPEPQDEVTLAIKRRGGYEE